jgi:predicted metal-dependent hydrolase
VTGLKARRTRFDLADTPDEWIPGDLQTTHVIDSLHVALPPGERWFCDVFRDALPLITDDELRDQVRGFIGQEATHAKAHDLGLEHLARQGIDLRKEVAWVDGMRLRLRRRIAKLPERVRRRVLRSELAAIATIEHYTATLGDWIVTAELPEGTDAQMLDLLRWHGAEEMEHRSVAFDLYEHIDGSYVRRAVFGVAASVGILLGLLLIAARIMALDPAARRNLRWRPYARAVQAGHFPQLGKIVASVRELLRRDYHPSQFGDLDAALVYLERSPGVRARASYAGSGPSAPGTQGAGRLAR